MIIDMVTISVRIKNVDGLKDDLKVVFLSFPHFHEYASRQIESKSTDTITVDSLIGRFKKDKQSASNDVDAIPIIGERNNFSKKSNSFGTVTCRIEKPGRTKTNKILIASER